MSRIPPAGDTTQGGKGERGGTTLTRRRGRRRGRCHRGSRRTDRAMWVPSVRPPGSPSARAPQPGGGSKGRVLEGVGEVGMREGDGGRGIQRGCEVGEG